MAGLSQIMDGCLLLTPTKLKLKRINDDILSCRLQRDIERARDREGERAVEKESERGKRKQGKRSYANREKKSEGH